MSNMNNLIQWPRAQYWDKPWNPIVGCKPCSPACENCYAAAWARRFGQSFEPHETKQRPPRKGVVFCGNMTDLFGEWRAITDMYLDIDMVMSVKNQTGYYLWLTKRVRNLRCALNMFTIRRHRIELLFNNHYFGFTAENQKFFEERVDPDYAQGFNYWLSLEPLLGKIDMYPIIRQGTTWPFRWVVIGCESGPNRRPCKIEWVESIVEQCRAANVPVFVKQLDIGGKCERDITKFPEHLRIRQVPWAKEGEEQ